MSALRDLQRSFQSQVLSGDPRIAGEVAQTPGVPAQVRLDVYSEAYRLRLRDALASTYPQLQELLGAAEFDALARQYIAAHPSQFASIRWFGDRLATALGEWHDNEPWLSELAEWEWALAAAFDARDRTALTTEALAPIRPEQWPGLRFEFHPSLQRLRLRTNAATMFKELSEALPRSEPLLKDEPRTWILWRQDSKTRYRSLDVSEAVVLDAAVEGESFSGLCELLCTWNTLEEVPLRSASLLKRWLADGLIVDAARG
jgi:hypothetical protein